MTEITSALEFLRSQAVAAKSPFFAATDQVPNAVWLCRDGISERIERDPPPRGHRVDTLESLVDSVKHYHDPGATSLWCSFAEIVAVLDDGEYRASRITFDLKPSEVLGEIEKHAGVSMDHSSLLRLLRFSLAGCYEDYPDLLPALRQVKVSRSQSSDSRLEHGDEQLGREIAAKITCAQALPDAVILEVPIFANGALLDSTQSIECGIDIDPFAGTFRLLPAPDAIEQAKQAAVRAIFDVLSRELADLKVPIFLGKP